MNEPEEIIKFSKQLKKLIKAYGSACFDTGYKASIQPTGVFSKPYEEAAKALAKKIVEEINNIPKIELVGADGDNPRLELNGRIISCVQKVNINNSADYFYSTFPDNMYEIYKEQTRPTKQEAISAMLKAFGVEWLLKGE